MSYQTLYQRATEEMNTLIVALLDLSERTAGFTNPPDEVWTEDEAARMLLGGLGYHSDSIAPEEQRKGAWLARSAIAFSIEHAVTRVLYERIQPFIDAMIETAYRETDISGSDARVDSRERPSASRDDARGGHIQ